MFIDQRQIYARTAFEAARFTYSTCGTFTKHCARIQKIRETGNLKHFYRNELGKSCLDHVAAYSDSKYLAKRTISDKIPKDRLYKIDRNSGYDVYQRELASMVFIFLIKTKEDQEQEQV